MAKRYYWLKLKEDFFNSKEIKKLRKIAGGDTYTIIYLKLMLLSLRDEGRVFFDLIEDTFAEELALEINEDAENVRVTLLYLIKVGLMQEVSDNEIYLAQIPELVGSETDKAELMRRRRAALKNSNAVTQNGNSVTEVLPPVTKCYTEIDIEKEKELDKELELDLEKEKDIEKEKIKNKRESKRESKHKYGEYSHVLLTDSEKDKLISEYGYPLTNEAITFLDEYIEMKGYKAKSHYLAIRKWVVDAVKERQQKQGRQNPQSGNRLDWIDNISL